VCVTLALQQLGFVAVSCWRKIAHFHQTQVQRGCVAAPFETHQI
jgi:hypothetical protein